VGRLTRKYPEHPAPGWESQWGRDAISCIYLATLTLFRVDGFPSIYLKVIDNAIDQERIFRLDRIACIHAVDAL